MKYQVEGHANLVRDGQTKAILNTNIMDYNNYISIREKKQSEIERIQDLENNVNEMKDDLNEIKNLLRSLVNESK